jgi:hypothetical protein
MVGEEVGVGVGGSVAGKLVESGAISEAQALISRKIKGRAIFQRDGSEEIVEFISLSCAPHEEGIKTRSMVPSLWSSPG